MPNNEVFMKDIMAACEEAEIEMRIEARREFESVVGESYDIPDEFVYDY